MLIRKQKRSANDIPIVFGGKAGADSGFFKTPSLSFVVARRFIFCGTKKSGRARRFKAIVQMSATGSGAVRLYDLTNGTAIARKNFSDTSWAIRTDWALENIPRNSAILEVQIKTDNVLQDAEISAAVLEF